MTDREWIHLPYFRHSPSAVLAMLEAQARRHELGAGVEVLREGEAANSLFFLARGTVFVTRRGRPTPVATVDAPSVFGEMALVAATPRLAGVTTAAPCVLFEVERGPVFAAVEKDAALRQTLLDFYHRRMAQSILAASPIFEPIAETDLRLLVAALVPLTVAPGHVFLQEGGQGTGLFIILRGTCEVLKSVGGTPQHVVELGEGELFGEISMALLDHACTATVRAVSECVVLCASPGDFQRFVMHDAELRHRVIQLALSRLNGTPLPSHFRGGRVEVA